MRPALRTWSSRRETLVLAAGLLLPRGLAAAQLPPTPRQTEGPFYPVKLPSDLDDDLVRVTGLDAMAMGQVTHVLGRVLDRQGRPLPGTLVEIWQCDANGRYHHPGDRGRTPDPAFQGYGRTLTDTGGGYRFRTIRPVAYPGRTPHIHFKVRSPDGAALTTQMYVRGEPLNERDGLLAGVRDPAARERLLVSLAPAPDLEAGALAGTFEIVLDV
jgi:protocatechuate 3,4-dioxygenase, beta subunit